MKLIKFSRKLVKQKVCHRKHRHGSLYHDVHNNLRKLIKGCMHNKLMVGDVLLSVGQRGESSP